MNKLMVIAGAAMVGMMVTGCATDNSNPVKEWQASRFMAKEINDVYATQKKLEVTDVMYKSKQEGVCAALGAPFNVLAPVPAALYLKVVTGVDQLDRELDGIELVRELNDRTNEKNPDHETKEAVFADWASREGDTYRNAKERYEKCVQAINNSDTNALIPMIEDIIKVQIPKALDDVQKTLQQVKADLDSGKIKIDATGFALLNGIKVMGEDAAGLSEQLSDVTVGAKHWLSLAQEVKEMKEAFSFAENVK